MTIKAARARYAVKITAETNDGAAVSLLIAAPAPLRSPCENL